MTLSLLCGEARNKKRQWSPKLCKPPKEQLSPWKVYFPPALPHLYKGTCTEWMDAPLNLFFSRARPSRACTEGMAPLRKRGL